MRHQSQIKLETVFIITTGFLLIFIKKMSRKLKDFVELMSQDCNARDITEMGSYVTWLRRRITVLKSIDTRRFYTLLFSFLVDFFFVIFLSIYFKRIYFKSYFVSMVTKMHD